MKNFIMSFIAAFLFTYTAYATPSPTLTITGEELKQAITPAIPEQKIAGQWCSTKLPTESIHSREVAL